MYISSMSWIAAHEETINWPTGANYAVVRGWGPGGAGGGSSTDVPGGAGASGAWFEAVIQRPTSGQSFISIGAGGAATPANSATRGATGGNTVIFRDGNSTDEWIKCSSNQGGGYPSISRAGGEAGSGGVVGWQGPGPLRWLPGGMGQASAANSSGQMPKGADAPGGGGIGACNGQDGQMGAGGSSGTNTVPGGKGGDGGMFIDFYS